MKAIREKGQVTYKYNPIKIAAVLFNRHSRIQKSLREYFSSSKI